MNLKKILLFVFGIFICVFFLISLHLIFNGKAEKDNISYIRVCSPFPNLAITVNVKYRLSFFGDMKDYSCVTIFESTDDKKYHIEIWASRYRSSDIKIEEYDLGDNCKRVEYKSLYPYEITYYAPYSRIECYTTSEDGKILHQTFYEPCDTSREKK